MAAGSQFSSSSSTVIDDSVRRVCYCGTVSPLRTSWTAENPGRRFYGCGNYQVTKSGFMICVDLGQVYL